MEKLKKNSTIKETAILSESKFFNAKPMVQTDIPALNIALSGTLDGGMCAGLLTVAAPSKHFKSLISLIVSKAYMDEHKDAIMLFYDSEFGTPKSYFQALDIDMDRVIHTPLTNMEQLKFDIMQQLEEVKRGEKLIIVLDSIGNLASLKEVEDAVAGKSVGDMSRAKQAKSLFRMITPHLTLKDLPMVVVAHTYQTQEMFSKTVVGSGTGLMYSSDTVLVIGKQQNKDGTELVGYNFVLNIEKSRHSKEKSKISLNVSFSGGLNKWSGLLDMAQESGHVMKPKNGWYSRVLNGVQEDKLHRAKDTNSKAFWEAILAEQSFKDWVKETYQISHGKLIQDEPVDEEIPSYDENMDD